MANSILLTGRITKDLELKQAGQVSKCDFTLAVDREYAKEGQQKTDFINITVFGKTAENLCKYQAKGSKILVLGALNIDQFQKDLKIILQTQKTTCIKAYTQQYLGRSGKCTKYK